MASPQIVNRRPDEGDTSVDALAPFRFGVRDTDTRADLTTVYSLAAYGRGIYAPSNGQLPAVDDVLEAAGVGVYFSTFDDAAGTTEPGNPCDQTLEVVSLTDVYRIEKSDLDGVAQEGVLFLTVDAPTRVQPCMFRAQIDLVNVNTDPFDYVTFSGFTGVLMGAAYWPENTGVFLFFVDDGTKKIVTAGPASDGIGTRPVSTTTVFDWSVKAYVYTVLVDPTVHARKVLVFVTDPDTGDETLLDEIDMDSLNEFNATVRIGALYAEDSPEKLSFLVGGDLTDQADYIDIYGIDVYDYGKVLLVGGAPTADVLLDVSATESLFAYGPDGVSTDWSTSGSPEITQTVAATKLTTTVGSEYIYRDEPDLSSGEWLVMGRLAGANSVHSGTYTSGMGLSLSDGTRAFNLTFLDDFTDRFLGIEESAAADDDIVSGYKTPSTDTDWEDGFDFVLLGSTSRDILRLYVDSDDTAAVDHTYTAAGYPAATTARLRLGFFDSASVSGDFYLAHLWLLPNCTFYEAVDATYPDAQGWTRTNSGSAVRALSAGRLEIDCATTGEYDIYSLTDATYDSTSGVAVVFRFELESWVDAGGALEPIRTEIGPVAAVQVTTGVAVQVAFTQSELGTFYIFLPGGASTYRDVLNRTATGRALSAEIDLSAPRVIHLDVKPRQYVRVYIDHNPVPVIDVDWLVYEDVVRTLPTNMPAAATVALGSLGEDTGVHGHFDFFRASPGRGYDLAITFNASESDLQDKIYGSLADLLIDVQDED
jgi:hypothetical protein